METTEAFEAEKRRRAATVQTHAVREAFGRELERMALKNELAELQQQRAEAERAEAAAALQRSEDENLRLVKENRRLRALLAGEDEDAEEKLAADLEWCEQYLRSQYPSAEETVATVRDAAQRGTRQLHRPR